MSNDCGDSVFLILGDNEAVDLPLSRTTYDADWEEGGAVVTPEQVSPKPMNLHGTNTECACIASPYCVGSFAVL